MNLILDQGNSSVKVGVFNSGELLLSERWKALSEKKLMMLMERFTIKQALCSSVAVEEAVLLKTLKKYVPIVKTWSTTDPLPLDNCYKTPETLGKDRLAACIGANFLAPDQNLLVIDAGTAITYDVVNANNQYVGGSISLGLDMRRKALNHFTKRLPLVNLQDEIPLIGTTTEEAILSGVVNGLVGEIDGFISNLGGVYPKLLVFLTGGNTKYFEKRIKNCNFAVPDLVLIGLNRILTFK
ncbi:MAG: type III pantothenate kinase [Bacteroidales bacterium]|nr:type III pantothenate kinase [Bacteroidales bacterium]